MHQATTKSMLHKLERLVEISRLLNGQRELDPLLTKIVDAAFDLTDSETSSIFLIEPETGLLRFVAAPKHDRTKLSRIRVPVENSIAGEAFESGEVVIVDDAASDERIFRKVDQELAFETRSIIAIPIKYGDETLGVLEAVNKRGNAHYTEEDVSVLVTLSTYAATAIFNTLLFEEANSAYKDIEDLEKMKSDFIAIASHELRTPLGLILGHASFLRDMVAEQKYNKQLDVIVKSAEKLGRLITDMANVDTGRSGKSRLRRRDVDLGELCRTTAASFLEDAKGRDVMLATNLPDEAVTIQADEEKIAIAIGNLINNAITFTDSGGRVLVTCEKLPGFAKVSVIDNGVGVPNKDLVRIFERFYQVESHLNRRHGGMGLGLSVARVMIEMHGGQIWAESVEGKGSNFSFLLPTGDEPGLKNVFAIE